MNKPCEYCGCDLPLGVDKRTRQQRSHHFATCKARPVPEVEPFAQRTWEEWFKWWRTSKVADSTEAEIDFADFMLIVRAVESEYGIKEKT